MNENKRYTENWAEEIQSIPSTSEKALKKGKKLEESRIRKGWRWVKVNHYTTILVPFGKNGEPTKEGLKRIAKFNKL